MIVNDFVNLAQVNSQRTICDVTSAARTENSSSFAEILAEKTPKCPYDHLAKDGLIQYNGVTLVCDYKTNSICLGDMSNPKDVLTISLPSGGSLKVNVRNFGDISKLAGMFSPQDLNAIMRAIYQYNHCVSTVNEMEEEEINTVESAADTSNTEETGTADMEEYVRKEDNSAYSRMGLEAFGIDTSKPFEINGKTFHFDSDGKIRLGDK